MSSESRWFMAMVTLEGRRVDVVPPVEGLNIVASAIICFGLSPGPLKRAGAEAVLEGIKRAHGAQEVAVVRLRKNPNENHEGTGAGDVEWSHRWLVHAHLRRLSDGRLTQVHEYIKGPQDRPLIFKPQVKAVVQ